MGFEELEQPGGGLESLEREGGAATAVAPPPSGFAGLEAAPQAAPQPTGFDKLEAPESFVQRLPGTPEYEAWEAAEMEKAQRGEAPPMGRPTSEIYPPAPGENEQRWLEKNIAPPMVGLLQTNPLSAALLYKVILPSAEKYNPGFSERVLRDTEEMRRTSATRIPSGVPVVGGIDPAEQAVKIFINMWLLDILGPGVAGPAGPGLVPPPASATAGSVAAAMGKQGAHTAALFGSLAAADKMRETGGNIEESIKATGSAMAMGFGVGMAFGAILNADQIRSLWANRAFRQAQDAVERASLSGDPKVYLAAQERMVRVARKIHVQRGDTAAVKLADKALGDIAGKKVLSNQTDILVEMQATGAIRRGLYAPQTYEQGLSLLGEDAGKLGLPSGFVERGVARAQVMERSGLGGPGIEKSLQKFIAQEARQAGATVPATETARLASQLRVLRSPEIWQTGPRVPSPFEIYSGYVTRGAAKGVPQAKAVAPVTGEEAPWFQRPAPRAPSLPPGTMARPSMTAAVRETIRGAAAPGAPAPVAAPVPSAAAARAVAALDPQTLKAFADRNNASRAAVKGPIAAAMREVGWDPAKVADREAMLEAARVASAESPAAAAAAASQVLGPPGPGREAVERMLREEAAAAAKEPWSMTETAWVETLPPVTSEQRQAVAEKMGWSIEDTDDDVVRAELDLYPGGLDHYNHVQQAVEQGKPVPSAVLADYPDLAAPAPSAKGMLRETKKAFGTTKDENEALYLLPDGTMTLGGGGEEEHRDFLLKVGARDPVDFGKTTGAIRMRADDEQMAFEIFRSPTEAQRRGIVRMADSREEVRVSIDATIEGGKAVFAWSEQNPSEMAIAGAIRAADAALAGEITGKEPAAAAPAPPAEAAKPKGRRINDEDFEKYLRAAGVPYVAVDEAKKALFGGVRLDAFDFVVYRESGPNWLVTCEPFKNKGITEKMGSWEEVFGEGFAAVEVFRGPAGMVARTLSGEETPLPAEKVAPGVGEGAEVVPGAVPGAQAEAVEAKRPRSRVLEEQYREFAAEQDYDPAALNVADARALLGAADVEGVFDRADFVGWLQQQATKETTREFLAGEAAKKEVERERPPEGEVVEPARAEERPAGEPVAAKPAAPAQKPRWPDLDPTDPADAKRILKEFSEIEEHIWPRLGPLRQIPGALTAADHAALDAAFRTAGVSIETGDESVKLWAIPGREAALKAVAAKIGRVREKKMGVKPKARPKARAKRKILPPRAKDAADKVLAMRPATAREDTRYALKAALVDGKNLVVTDGRRLWIAQGEWGKDGIYDIEADGKLRKRPPKTAGVFPTYQDVVPFDVAHEIQKPLAEVKIEETLRRLRQAATMTSEENRGVLVVLNQDGSIGFASNTPDEGTAEVNVQPEHRELFAVDPDFLRQQLEWHYRLGDDTVFVNQPKKPKRSSMGLPITTYGVQGKTVGVLMPMSVVEAEEVKPTPPVEALEGPAEPQRDAAEEFLDSEEGSLGISDLWGGTRRLFRTLYQKVWAWEILSLHREMKPAQRAVGREPVARVIRAVHESEAAKLDFSQRKVLAAEGKTVEDLYNWFARLPSEYQRDFMLAYGRPPMTLEGAAIQRAARNRIPDKVAKMGPAFREIADMAYENLQQSMPEGQKANYFESYFYGRYDIGTDEQERVFTRFTKRFLKEKKIPTPADAYGVGLRLRNLNPVGNLMAEVNDIARLRAIRELNEDLRTLDLILDEADAPPNWKPLQDKAFGLSAYAPPDLATLVNSLLAPNWFSRGPIRRGVRGGFTLMRTIKLAIPVFHYVTISEQVLADAGPLGFLMPWKWPRLARELVASHAGITAADKRSEMYRLYVRNGGERTYSFDEQARMLVERVVMARGEVLGKARLRRITAPLRLPGYAYLALTNQVFKRYIPKVKYYKFLDEVAKHERRLGRALTEAEIQDVIRTANNFYGMMNERLLGRSGTVTSAMRWIFMAPGFGEGNFGTLGQAAAHWRGFRGKMGWRARWNIVNFVALQLIIAGIVRYIWWGETPELPEEDEPKVDWLRDQFKVKTGTQDRYGNDLYLDMLTGTGKDYWRALEPMARAVEEKDPTLILETGDAATRRISNMTTPLAGTAKRFLEFMAGDAAHDWKGAPLYYKTDPFLMKLEKLARHELTEYEPIPLSVYKQQRRQHIPPVTALWTALVGIRPVVAGDVYRQRNSMRRFYDLRNEKEQLYWYLDNMEPGEARPAVERYNEIVSEAADVRGLSDENRTKIRDLQIDVPRYLENRAHQLGGPSIDARGIQRILRVFEAFEVEPNQIEKYLRAYWRRHPLKAGGTTAARMARASQAKKRIRGYKSERKREPL